MTKFCKALTNAVSFRIPGDSSTMTFNPCCVYDENIPFHSTIYQRHRTMFSNATDFLPGCHRCKTKEHTHGWSQRTMMNEELSDNDGITKLEVVLDTTCNAACIQCSPAQSSLWRKELAYPQKIIHIQPEQQIARYIEDIKSNIDISKVELFHFWGGEPLLTDTHLKFIENLVDVSQVSLVYTTNMSIMPNDQLLKLWEGFKNVRINASIDGMGDKFEYIRWPISWEKASRNMINWKANASMNTDFGINCCALSLNVFYIDELQEWLDKNFSKTSNGNDIPYMLIRGEGSLDAACTPLALREAIWKKYGEDHVVSKILKDVPYHNHMETVDYLDRLDPTRKQNWRHTFKEIVQYFKP